MLPQFQRFTGDANAVDGLRLGADALLYVMQHGHTISVSDRALLFAQKVGVLAIARRDTAAPVLLDVNRALDAIGASLRRRDRLDKESAAQPGERATAVKGPAKDGRRDDGTRVPVHPAPKGPAAPAFAAF